MQTRNRNRKRRDAHYSRHGPTHVICPLCGGKYEIHASATWARREARRLCGYPQVACSPCKVAVERAARLGGTWQEWRNPELACC